MAFVIDRKLEIAAPASVVWEVISDLPRYPEWNRFCIEARSTLRPGDAIDLRVQLFARPQWQREYMTEFAAGRGFAYSMKPVPAGALSSRRSHSIEALDAERCVYESCFRLQGWLMPLVRSVLGRRLKAGFAVMNEGVRQRAEYLWTERQKGLSPAG